VLKFPFIGPVRRGNKTYWIIQNSLYEWIQPNLPENISFSIDGEYLLIKRIERDCFYYLPIILFYMKNYENRSLKLKLAYENACVN